MAYNLLIEKKEIEMPKKGNSKTKCFNFSEKTLLQMDYLCDNLMLNQTSLLSFLINEKWKEEVRNGKTNETDQKND